MQIQDLLNEQKEFFRAGTTKETDFRISALKSLRKEIVAREKEIYKCLYLDLKKPDFEIYGSEISIVKSELNLMIKKLKRWSKPKRVRPVIA